MDLFQVRGAVKVRRLITVMVPILVSQAAIMGMSFFDASMSGHAGNNDLAGASVAGNTISPLLVGLSGILTAATPLIANALGAKEPEKVRLYLKQGILLAIVLGLLVIVPAYWWVPALFSEMNLEAEVYRIGIGYWIGAAVGFIPFYLTVPLRALIDTSKRTDISMKLYLSGLPINGLLNYVLIFGKCGLPALGGIGAGVATGITNIIIFLMFIFVVYKREEYRQYFDRDFSAVDISGILAYLRMGIPIGLSIFAEVAIFCIMGLFTAKFGTDVIAAHQAAMNFSCLIYTIPMSFSMALTIVIGIEYGARRYNSAGLYDKVGLQLSVIFAFIYIVLEYIFSMEIAGIYSNDIAIKTMFVEFLFWAMVWQCGDTIAAPIQGILRGYKDVDSALWGCIIAYWIVCLPLGLALDLFFEAGAVGYWQSLSIGVLCSAVFMLYRRRRFYLRLKQEKGKMMSYIKNIYMKKSH